MNKQTGVIGEFEVAWFKEVKNSKIVEDLLHYIFEEYRYQKEFFNIDLDVAKERCEEVVSEFEKFLLIQKLKLKERIRKIRLDKL